MAADAARNPQGRFGTFGGVFTPCVLTILGVIMFMRAGYVVGSGGLFRALIILGIAKAITSLTAMSLSAISTNTEIRTGGVYYMISRTLGSDFGGAIGLTLFVSQAVSVAFYVIGFSEALFALAAPSGSEAAVWVATYRVDQWVSTVTVLAVFGVTFKGADVAVRTQYAILAILVVSIVSFLIGGLIAFDSAHLSSNLTAPDNGDPFWIIFAIFFPAATGITAGANMSGDLKEPSVAIPRGTLMAIGFTAVVYFVELVLLAGFRDGAALAADPFGAIKAMSIFAPLVMAGVFAATLSSALGSFLGAPRILQAMGQDRIIEQLAYFGAGHGPSNEPRRATVLTLVIAVAVVWAGSLDAVAQVISMFFLITYGMINLSAFVESRGGNPSFRPLFKFFGWPTAIAGAILCAVAMVKIDETYAIIAMAIATLVYFFMRSKASGDWGDAKRGYVFSRARENLLTLEGMAADPKNWRPKLAFITDDAQRDQKAIECASWIESERGVLFLLEVVAARDEDPVARLNARARHTAALESIADGLGARAFTDAVVVSEPRDSLETIIQSYSVGAMRPNTLMFCLPPEGNPERRQTLVTWLKTVAPFGLNVVIYKGGRIESHSRRIDVWWHGQRNGSLLALFAYLASNHKDWPRAKIRMMRAVRTGEDPLDAESNLREMMIAARLDVDVEVILSTKSIAELIAERSASADLVLLGMAEADLGRFDDYLERNDPLLSALPPTLIVLSNGEADLLA